MPRRFHPGSEKKEEDISFADPEALEKEAQRRGVTPGFLRAEKAQQIRKTLLGEQMASLKAPITKTSLVVMGTHFWPFTYAKSPTYEGAVEALINTIQELQEKAKTDSRVLYPMWSMIEALEIPDTHMQFMGSCRWVDQGLPVVVLGERYAAALMSTSVPQEVLMDVRSPWKAFLIEIPPIGLVIQDGAVSDEIRRILVWYEPASEAHPEDGWSYFTMCNDKALTLWCVGTLNMLADPDVSKISTQWDALPFGITQDDRDKRLQTLIHRLILNTCLAMSDPANLTAVGGVHKQAWSGPSQRWLKEPTFRHYRVGAPVSIDCRQTVRDYVEGQVKRGSLTVQIMVRGYWKFQHHGPKAALRKRIWVEPYWKGPEDAPILVRPHQMPDES